MSIGKIFVFALILFLFFTPKATLAQSSCCSANGGEYACDYSTNELYCRDGTVSKECICKQVTPTLSSSPTPSSRPTSLPTLPSCVPYSAYDESLKMCKCSPGYIVKDNSCVTYTQYCWGTFGGNSTYDSGNNSCICSAGYSWNNEGKSCISLDQVCKNKLGDKSYYNYTDNTCNCFNDYFIQNDKCSPLPSPIPPNTQIVTEVKISAAPLPTPSLAEVRDSSISPTIEANEESSTLAVKDGGNTPFVSESKPQKNVIIQLISNIWNFITRIF